jgi:hypothetical protein
MVKFSPSQLIFTILFLYMFLLFNGGNWVTRPGSIARKIVTDGSVAGLVVALYVPGSVSPWTWPACVAWIIILLSSSVISTTVVWFAAARVSGPVLRGVAGVTVGLVVGVATVATEAFVMHQLRPDLLTDPISSVLAIGALVGALAGVLLEFNRRQAWSAT